MWRVIKKNGFYQFYTQDVSRVRTFRKLGMDLVGDKIKLYDSGEYKFTLNFSQVEFVGSENEFEDMLAVLIAILGVAEGDVPVEPTIEPLLRILYEDLDFFVNDNGIDKNSLLDWQNYFNATFDSLEVNKNEVVLIGGELESLTFDVFTENYEILELEIRNQLSLNTLNILPKIKINYFNFISNCPLLETILIQDIFQTIGNIEVKSFNGIQNIQSLKSLSISFAEIDITSVSGLSTLNNLEQLAIISNNLQLIPVLNIPSLKELNISATQISVIENLQGLPNLEILALSFNNISVIENLEVLPNLKVLAIQGNNISVLQNISSLVNLEGIDLFGNNISVITDISNLVNLSNFNLSNNEIITEGWDNLENWANVCPENGIIRTVNNIDAFNTSNTSSVLVSKNWTIF